MRGRLIVRLVALAVMPLLFLSFQQTAHGASATRLATTNLLTVINQERADHQGPALHLDQRLSRCALLHAQHMAQMGALSHDQFQADVCVAHRTAGENVGMAQGDIATAVLFVNHLMMAEGPCPHPTCSAAQFELHGHYMNLTNRSFTRVGIGIYYHDGIVWVTEDFVG